MPRHALALALVLLGCSIPDGRFACRTDEQCPSEFSCRSGLCWRGDPARDAGLDGSAADAATMDAGVVDAGAVDASGRDADVDAGPGRGCPVPLTEGRCVDAIAAGYTTCVVRPGGGVRCWGYNGEVGALGDGLSTHTKGFLDADCSPSAVAVVGVLAQSLASGNETACAITSAADSELICWGLHPNTGIGSPAPTALSVASPPTYVGVRDALAVVASGSMYVGGNDGQRRGLWGSGAAPPSPEPTRRALPTTDPTLMDVRAAEMGFYHACAVLGSGRAQCWGRNEQGELGDRTTTDRAAPVDVVGLSGITQLAAGVNFTCALIGTNVHCWGTNLLGQLGRVTSGAPSAPDATASGRVASLTDVQEIEAGLDFACARRGDGTVWCWGSDEFGQLGDDAAHAPCGAAPCSTTRVQVAGITSAIDLAAGAEHACALLAEGGVRCWGRNHFGQLGDGTFTDRSTSVAVPGL